MRRTIESLQILVFSLFLAGPVLALLVFGEVERYGFDFAKFPKWRAIIEHPARRKALGDAILDRSILRREAVSARNRLNYGLFGYLDTPQIVSGIDGWLFFKRQFFDGRCLGEAELAGALRHLDTMAAFAGAGRQRLLVSVAPDKSILYPDKLHPRARAYWGCKAATGALWRTLALREAPDVIDLAAPLAEARRRDPSTLVYFPHDTHWTRAGSAVARRTLVSALAGKAVTTPPPKIAPTPVPFAGDLSQLLLLGLPPDLGPDVDPLPEGEVAAVAALLSLGKTAFVHDSFVRVWIDDFRATFPGDYIVVKSGNEAEDAQTIAAADTILAMTVERDLVNHVRSGMLGWSFPLGLGILERNRQLAAGCTMAPAALPPAGEGPVVVAIPSTPGRLPCLSIALKAKEGTIVTVTLPNADGDLDAAAAASPIQIALPAKDGDIRLVLPASVMGREVAVGFASPGRRSEIAAVGLGTLPDAAATAPSP